MNPTKIVCKLCLNVLDSEPETVDRVTRHILDVLQIQMNFDTSEDSAMCKNCSEIIKKLLVFKSVYVDIERMVLEFSLRDNKTIMDLKDVYKVEKVDFVLDQEADVCRLCMKWSKVTDLTLINALLKDSLFTEMWTKHMNEVDLTITEYPKVCVHCKDIIRCYFIFILDVRTGKGKIDLTRHSKINLIQSLLKMYKCLECNYETLRKCNFSQHTKIHQDRSQLKMYKCRQCSYETHRENHLKQHTKIHHDRIRLKIHKCCLCNYKTDMKCHLNRHARIHQDRSQLKMYKCHECTYETHRKCNLTQHETIHQDRSQLKMYKCQQCSYETHRKNHLTQHTKIHQDRSRLTMFRCTKCSYQTFRRRDMDKHAKLKIHKCLQCNYETHMKHNLQEHTKTHQGPKRTRKDRLTRK